MKVNARLYQATPHCTKSTFEQAKEVALEAVDSWSKEPSFSLAGAAAGLSHLAMASVGVTQVATSTLGGLGLYFGSLAALGVAGYLGAPALVKSLSIWVEQKMPKMALPARLGLAGGSLVAAGLTAPFVGGWIAASEGWRAFGHLRKAAAPKPEEFSLLTSPEQLQPGQIVETQTGAAHRVVREILEGESLQGISAEALSAIRQSPSNRLGQS